MQQHTISIKFANFMDVQLNVVLLYYSLHFCIRQNLELDFLYYLYCICLIVGTRSKWVSKQQIIIVDSINIWSSFFFFDTNIWSSLNANPNTLLICIRLKYLTKVLPNKFIKLGKQFKHIQTCENKLFKTHTTLQLANVLHRAQKKNL